LGFIKHFADSGEEEVWHSPHLLKKEDNKMKVHIVQWATTGNIYSVYSDYDEANNVVDKLNEKLTWKHKLAEAINGKLCKYVVKTYRVK